MNTMSLQDQVTVVTDAAGTMGRAVVRALLQPIPVGRFCEPEAFAHVVSFLVSPMSGFITGELIDLNGGLHRD